MPRPKKPGSAEPKKRSRNGCWPCKNRKIKCGEERPQCQNCQRQGEECDYSIRLNWEGRTKRKSSNENQPTFKTLSPPLKFERSTSSNSVATVTTESTMKENSPNHMPSFMNGFSTNPTSPGLYQFQAHPPPAVTAQASRPVTTPNRDSMSSTHLSRIRDQGSGQYPSPANSSLDSPPLPLQKPAKVPMPGHHYSSSNPEMPPPFQNPPNSLMNPSNLATGFDSHRSKKIRLSPTVDRFESYQNNPNAQLSNQFASTGTLLQANPASMAPLISPPAATRYHSSSPLNVGPRIPPTPAASIGSDENYNSMTGPSPQPLPQESPDFRRLSVKSLLSDDSPIESSNSSEAAFPGRLSVTTWNNTQKTKYGVDRGFPDLDLPRNEDDGALNGSTPNLDYVDLAITGNDSSSDLFSGFAFGLNNPEGFQEGQGYYAKPVAVTISKHLEPLPDMLRHNPMNLLYFHHFVNHTARILVPHDCSENPFKSILPQMAVQDTNLLNLLLTYSASHRSRLLNHAEPSVRIATWMNDVFPSLRKALDDPSRQISNSNLATAIMLASLQVINPNTFAVSVPWQQHLHVARQMILARGGPNSVHRKDKVSYFLTRWFAYLDVLGSLSGGSKDKPLFSGKYWANDNTGEEQDYQIDCLLGFTSRCVSILARIAELARICDSERIDFTGNIRQGWQPSPQTMEEAAQLKNDLIEARQHRYQGCPHRRASTQIDASSYAVELVTTNEAFHHAGFIHVNRRILGRPSTDMEVQFAVREIVSALYKVRKGGTAEGCLLFPMFTAGCDALDTTQRAKIMERLQRMEGLGMSHVKKARALMEKVWETGRPWESLVTGDFFLG